MCIDPASAKLIYDCVVALCWTIGIVAVVVWANK